MPHRNTMFYNQCRILLAFEIKILLFARKIYFLLSFRSCLLRMCPIENDLGENLPGCKLFWNLFRLHLDLDGRGFPDQTKFAPIFLDYWNQTFQLCLNNLDVLLCQFHKICKQINFRTNMKCDKIFPKLILQFLSTHFFQYYKLRTFLRLVVIFLLHFLWQLFDFRQSSMHDAHVLDIAC